MLLSLIAPAQARVVINGGIISIKNGAVLVIDNPDNQAISQTGGGYISSEGINNSIIWSVGAGNGNMYAIPFGNAYGMLPLHFSAASGSAGGRIIFSTYPTPTWKNSDYLPPGVTNVNSGATDNSAKVIDRFWQINPQGYLTKPTLTNLSFTYAANEYQPPNTIAEANLVAQRWNSSLLAWGDYIPASIINTSAKTITIASVPGNQLYDWWTLVDLTDLLPVTLLNFQAIAANKKVIASWETASETNSDHFELWRSRDQRQFDLAGKVAAAGNSTGLLRYSFTDAHPYFNISYYQLKMVNLDGSFKWSPVIKVKIDDDPFASIYPNPATGYITIAVGAGIALEKPIAYIYDAKGSLVKSFKISATSQLADMSLLPAGMYFIHFTYSGQAQTLSFIKK